MAVLCKSVSRLSRLKSTEKKHHPCDTKLGDEIEVYIKNLGLWLRDIEKSKIIETGVDKGDIENRLPYKQQDIQALVIKSVPKLCILIDGHPLSTVRADSYYSDPNWTDEYPFWNNEEGPYLQDMTAKQKEDWDTIIRPTGDKARDDENIEKVRKQAADGQITRVMYYTISFHLIRDGGDLRAELIGGDCFTCPKTTSRKVSQSVSWRLTET